MEDRKTIDKNNQPGDYNNAAIVLNQSQAINFFRSNRHRLNVIHEENEEPINGNPGV